MQAMGMMNKQLNMPALQKIMREFERQNERMEMTSEMMGDAIDDAFEVSLNMCLTSISVSCKTLRKIGPITSMMRLLR